MNSNWSYSPETHNLGKIYDFFSRVTLKFDGWPLKTRGHLNIKLYASFHHRVWIQTGVTVRKRLNWVMTSVTLTFDLWPWPFAWTSLLSLAITPEHFVILRWQEHSEKGVTGIQTDRQKDRQTDRQTERGVLRAAWSQLKMLSDDVTQVVSSVRSFENLGTVALLYGNIRSFAY